MIRTTINLRAATNVQYLDTEQSKLESQVRNNVNDRSNLFALLDLGVRHAKAALT